MTKDEIGTNFKSINTLTEEEFKELFFKFKNGDDEAYNKLFMHNFKLVLYEVNNHFYSVNCDKDDLIQEGSIGLMNAINCYDINRHTKFSTFAFKCIRNSIYKYINNLTESPVSINLPVNKCKENKSISIESTLIDDVDIEKEYVRNETQEEVRRAISELSEKEQEIICLYYGINRNKLNTIQIALKFNTTRSNISRIILSIYRKLRLKLIKNTYSKEQLDKIVNKNLIYEYFSKSKKEDVDEVISSLPIKEQKLIRKKFLDYVDLSKEEKTQIRRIIIPKIKRRLNKLKIEYIEQTETKELRKDDYSEILTTIQTPQFNEMVSSLGTKGAIIMALRLGSVDSKCFSVEFISKFLGISEEEINEIIKKSLFVYNKNFNKLIDETIKLTDKQKTLK